MAFIKIAFSTIDEFLAIVRKTKLSFVLFGRTEHASFADAFGMEEDEAGYYVDVLELNGECFNILMRNSPIDLRARPGQGEVNPVPNIRSFIRGVGFVDTYFFNEERDIGKFLERSRAEKKLAGANAT